MHRKHSRLSFNRRSLALFASLALGSGLASAQFTVGPAPTGAKAPAAQQAGAFAKLDTDGNGSISRKEAAAGGVIARQFDALDSNHDGLLSPAEFDRASK